MPKFLRYGFGLMAVGFLLIIVSAFVPTAFGGILPQLGKSFGLVGLGVIILPILREALTGR